MSDLFESSIAGGTAFLKVIRKYAKEMGMKTPSKMNNNVGEVTTVKSSPSKSKIIMLKAKMNREKEAPRFMGTMNFNPLL